MMKNFQFSIFNFQKRLKTEGFTIVESLVAITILILAITGVTSAIQTGISSYIFSKDQVIAFYLAQEGFEQIRNIRDENGLKNQNWLTGLDPCFSSDGCYVDVVSGGVPITCPVGTCPVLKQDVATSFFGYNSGWPDTIFKRKITLTQINNDEVSLLVTVNWSKGVVLRQFKVRESLLNWQ